MDKKIVNNLEDTLMDSFSAWQDKVSELKTEISHLSSLQSNPIINAPSISIAVFLLKSQIIEFEVKNLIGYLDSLIMLNLKGDKSKVNINKYTEKDMNSYTLGKSIGILGKYKYLDKSSDQFEKDLYDFSTLRNTFTHKLFNQRVIMTDLKTEATKAIKQADDIEKKIRDYELAVLEEINKKYKEIPEPEKSESKK